MKLLFVYNADSSAFAQLKDVIHKTISPATYQCNLCGLTYGAVSMKNEWKEFISKLTVETEFLHKDKFLAAHPNYQNTVFPIIFMQKNNELKTFLTSEEINKAKSLNGLKELITNKIT